MDSGLLKKILNNPARTIHDKNLIQEAFDFARNAHAGQKRASGDDYIDHPLAVAAFLSNLGFDTGTIIAGLLHDTLEDTKARPEEIEKEFGKDILFLVQSVTKLGKIEYSSRPHSKLGKIATEHYLSSLKKMFLAMAEDIRVIIIKLADRYHNMETLASLPKADQKRIAEETMDIYAPIAARLGMGKIKGELEDMAFPYVHPQEYSSLMKKVKEKYNDRMDYIDRTRPLIKRRLADAGVRVLEVNSRAKHYYSLYQKMTKKDYDLDEIFDLVAIRIIVPDITSCYEAMGTIHKFYKPLPGLIKDYIAVPKPNGYRSLHTTIFCEKGRIVEIQIRTPEMHDHAEHGIAAHWAYSEGNKRSVSRADIAETRWVNQLKKFLTEDQADLSGLKIDFFKSRIFAFTPKGELRDLPDGATPIDFAYSIHTGLGHSLQGAKVNGKIVPLDYALQSGDVVEIIKKKIQKPSFDWLKIAKTAEARKKIKAWFSQQETPSEKPEEKIEIKRTRQKTIPVKIDKLEPVINGQTGLLYKLAKCCRPDSTQKIKGYMTLNRGVTIHSSACSNIKNASSQRLIEARWDKK